MAPPVVLVNAMADGNAGSDSTDMLEVTLRQSGPIRLDIDFRCARGRTLALIGPSGAGKTTILRSIAGLYRPASARIVSNGIVWSDTQTGQHVPAHRRRIGMVFQSYALFPHLSARENVEVALTHVASTQRAAAAQQLLTRVGLAESSEHAARNNIGTRRPSTLSGGEQQRVALARALARDPDVLLLDEPFSAIDRRTRRHLRADLAALRGQLQAPIILVTHDVDEALTLADDVVIVDHGVVLQSGPTAQVQSAPANDAVRAILDLPGS